MQEHGQTAGRLDLFAVELLHSILRVCGEFAQKQIQVAVLVEIDEGGAEADGREFV